MEFPSEQPDWVVAGALLLAVLGFGAREVVGGVLRAVGHGLWRSYKHRCRKARDCSRPPSEEPGVRAGGGGRSGPR